VKKISDNFFRVYKREKVLLEALRRHEGFRRDPDEAFAKFWAREGDSLSKRPMIKVDENGRIISTHNIMGEYDKPDENPLILSEYFLSPEAQQVSNKYGLTIPFHYKYGVPGKNSISCEPI
jgi:hypothetical protein